LSTKTVGLISFCLGSGRLSKNDKIDYHAGIYLNKVKNEYVNKNEVVATLYSSKPISNKLSKTFLDNLSINSKPHKNIPIIIKVLG
jgi:pyrimidine-nucleoside phosphorylase